MNGNSRRLSPACRTSPLAGDDQVAGERLGRAHRRGRARARRRPPACRAAESSNSRGKRALASWRCTSGTCAVKPARSPRSRRRSRASRPDDARTCGSSRAAARPRAGRRAAHRTGALRVAGRRARSSHRVGDLVAQPGVRARGQSTAWHGRQKVGRTTVHYARRTLALRRGRIDEITGGPQRRGAATTSSATSTRLCARRSARSRSGSSRPTPTMEETTFPDWVFRRMGELGLLVSTSRAQRPGRHYFTSLVCRGARPLALRRLAMGVACTPTWRYADPRIGTEQQKQEWAVPAIAGHEDPLASGSPSLMPAPTSRRSRPAPSAAERRGVCHQRLQDVHHQRPPRRRDVLVTKTDPAAGHDGFTLFSCRWTCPRRCASSASRSSACTRAKPAARLPGRPRAASAVLGEVAGLLTHHVGAPGRAADRRRSAVAAPSTARPHAAATRWSGARSAADRPLPGHPAQVRRDGDEDRVGAPDGLHDRLAHANGEYPVREISMAKLHACVAARSPTSASRSTAARLHARVWIERVWPTAPEPHRRGTDEIMLDLIGRSYGLWIFSLFRRIGH